MHDSLIPFLSFSRLNAVKPTFPVSRTETLELWKFHESITNVPLMHPIYIVKSKPIVITIWRHSDPKIEISLLSDKIWINRFEIKMNLLLNFIAGVRKPLICNISHIVWINKTNYYLFKYQDNLKATYKNVVFVLIYKLRKDVAW